MSHFISNLFENWYSQAAIKLYPAPAVKSFFLIDSTSSWDLYCISAGYQEDILERSEKIEQIQNGRHLVKVKLQIDSIFDRIEQLLDFGVHYKVFRYARSSGVVRNNFGHCIVGKIQDGRHLSKVKQ